MVSDLKSRAEARRELALRRARVDLAAFVEFVFGFHLGEHHRRWCDALSREARLVLLAPVEHGKTTLSSLALPLWTLGRNPGARIALISETHTQAARLLAAIRENILSNPKLREVFPRLVPAKGARASWSDSEILVERPVGGKDPSVVALGVNGPLLGARLDLAILDDVCSFENTFTSGQRQKLVSWFRSTLVGRVVDSGRVVSVGTAWHDEDLLQTLSLSSQYQTIRDPAIKQDGEPLWPEAWSLVRISQRRVEIGELEFSRQMLLKIAGDLSSRFRHEWVERAFELASLRGACWESAPQAGERVYTGVDLGVGVGAQHDLSVLFTLSVLPSGERRVLSIRSGRWRAPELVEQIARVQLDFGGRVRVESNGAQAYISHFLEERGIHVESRHTGQNKHDRLYGVESLAVELEREMWLVPDSQESREWAKELISYRPGAHTGDRLMAAWLAREAAREDESAPVLSPSPGLSEFWNEAEDEACWVLGPSRPKNRELGTTIPSMVPRPERKRRPWIVA